LPHGPRGGVGNFSFFQREILRGMIRSKGCFVFQSNLHEPQFMYLDRIESLFFVEHIFKSLSPFCGNSPAVIQSTRENGGSLAYGCFFGTPTHSSLKPLIKEF